MARTAGVRTGMVSRARKSSAVNGVLSQRAKSVRITKGQRNAIVHRSAQTGRFTSRSSGG
jgi:hypothetical protein